MATENDINNKKTQSRTLSIVATTNAILWILSIVALIFIMQNSSSPKGLFILLAAGLSAALAIISALPKQE